jgi:hypothetical protein
MHHKSSLPGFAAKAAEFRIDTVDAKFVQIGQDAEVIG